MLFLSLLDGVSHWDPHSLSPSLLPSPLSSRSWLWLSVVWRFSFFLFCLLSLRSLSLTPLIHCVVTLSAGQCFKWGFPILGVETFLPRIFTWLCFLTLLSSTAAFDPTHSSDESIRTCYLKRFIRGGFRWLPRPSLPPLPPIPFSVGRGVDSPRFRVSSPRSWLPLLVRLLTVQGLLLISLNSTHFYSWRPQFALAFDPDIPYAPRDGFVLCLSNAFLLFGILHQYALFIASSGFDQCTWWIEWANGPLPITICLLTVTW